MGILQKWVEWTKNVKQDGMPLQKMVEKEARKAEQKKNRNKDGYVKDI